MKRVKHPYSAKTHETSVKRREVRSKLEFLEENSQFGPVERKHIYQAFAVGIYY